MNEQTVSVLIGVKQLLEPEGTWIRGSLAHSIHNHVCSPLSPHAACWCLDGAVIKVASSPFYWWPWRGMFKGDHWKDIEIGPVDAALNQASFKYGYRSYVKFNDAPGRTKEEVLKLVDDAILIALDWEWRDLVFDA